MIENQAYLFLIFTLVGIFIGALFDFFRILRISFKTKDFITYIQDFIFWILTGLLILYSIFYFNNGEIRIFMFIGMAIGVMIYMLLISNYILKSSVYIIKSIKKIIKLLTYPIKNLLKVLNEIFKKPIMIFVKKIQQIWAKVFRKLSKKTKKLKNNEEI